MDILPLELRLRITSYLPHIDFFNYCHALESCKRSSRAYVVERLNFIVRHANRYTSSLLNLSKTDDDARRTRIDLEGELYDFYLTLITARGLESYFMASRMSIMNDVTVFNNRLPAPIFLAWHQAIFSNWRAARQIRLTHSHGKVNCGVCTASSAIARLSRHSPWRAGGWPVVRDNSNGTATYIDTIHSTSLNPLDILKYPGNHDAASYHILWPFGQSIASESVLRLIVILQSEDREHVDSIAYQYARVITN